MLRLTLAALVNGELNNEICELLNAASIKWRESDIPCGKMKNYFKSLKYSTIVRLVALYSIETWPTTLGDNKDRIETKCLEYK